MAALRKKEDGGVGEEQEEEAAEGAAEGAVEDQVRRASLV